MFSIAEKLALVNAIDSVIVADQSIHPAELHFLNQLMNRLDFDSNFIIQARNVPQNHVRSIIMRMPEPKKTALFAILDDVASADGFVHKKELEVIMGISTEALLPMTLV